jgi:ribose transport system permease protein
MNEKLKFGAALVAGSAITIFVWLSVGFPLTELPFSAWMVTCALSLALLFTTFDVSIRNLQRLAGVVVLLGVMWAVLTQSHPNALGRSNLLSIFNRHGEYGIVCLGAGLLMIAGGIDLSMGSLIALAAVTFGLQLEAGVQPIISLFTVLLGGFLIGLVHGVLVTKLGLQAFLVTLCGMFVYRGLARTLKDGQIGMVSVMDANANTPGFAEQLKGLRYWLTGLNPDERLVFPGFLAVALLLTAVAAVFLHRTAYGRYWYAIGYNEQATKYAGIATWKHKLTLFGVCSLMASLAGVMLFLSAGSITPSTEGNGYELYAITAAVLGGVSLKGGQGTAVGLLLGAMVLPVVKSVMVFKNSPQAWENWIIGLILLLGATVDEFIRRVGQKRR